MQLATIRKYALSLPEAVEAPHFDHASFRVRGKIFVTVPPGGAFLHVMAPEEARERALAMDPGAIEKLLWGSKVLGVRIALARADPAMVKALVLGAWQAKAPRSLQQPGAAP